MKKTKTAINAIFLATVMFMAGSKAHAAPANDQWSDATLITGASGSMMGTVTGSTTQACEPQLQLPDEGIYPPQKTVWFKWQAPANGSYTFSFDDASLTTDPVLAAYVVQPGLCNGNVIQMPYQIAANHDYNSEYNLNLSSQVTFRAAAGQVIHISVGAFNNHDGDFLLKWTKTKFRPDVLLDHKNGAADLAITRSNTSGMNFWTYRYGPSTTFLLTSAVRYGYADDKAFMADYDGDRISDLVCIRRQNGNYVWWISNRDGQVIKVATFGLSTDEPIIGDYDGDGIADIAVIRDDPVTNTKTWHILRSKDGQYAGLQFGLATDRPMAGDYDGDGKTDIVALRPENGLLRWYILLSTNNNVATRVFGNASGGDIPQNVDFDGDGKTDVAVFRRSGGDVTEYDGYWFSLDSSSPLPLDQRPTRYRQFGQRFDDPQPADYDGDGKTDPAVYRDGIWWIGYSRSAGFATSYSFGLSSDIPVTDGGMLKAQLYYY